MGPDTSHIRSAFFHRWSVFSLSLLVLFNKPCLSYITIYPKYIMCIFVHIVIFTLSLLCMHIPGQCTYSYVLHLTYIPLYHSCVYICSSCDIHSLYCVFVYPVHIFLRTPPHIIPMHMHVCICSSSDIQSKIATIQKVMTLPWWGYFLLI